MRLEILLGMFIHVRRVQECFGGDAANVQAGATETTTGLDASHLSRRGRAGGRRERGKMERDRQTNMRKNMCGAV